MNNQDNNICDDCKNGQKLLDVINEELNYLNGFTSIGKNDGRVIKLIKQSYEIQQEMNNCKICK